MKGLLLVALLAGQAGAVEIGSAGVDDSTIPVNGIRNKGPLAQLGPSTFFSSGTVLGANWKISSGTFIIDGDAGTVFLIGPSSMTFLSNGHHWRVPVTWVSSVSARGNLYVYSLLSVTSGTFTESFTAGTGATATFNAVGISTLTVDEVYVGTGPVISTFTQDGNAIIPGYLRADGGLVLFSTATINRSGDGNALRWTNGTQIGILHVQGTIGAGISANSNDSLFFGSNNQVRGGVSALGHWTIESATNFGREVDARLYITTGANAVGGGLYLQGDFSRPFRIGVSTYVIYADQIYRAIPETAIASTTFNANVLALYLQMSSGTFTESFTAGAGATTTLQNVRMSSAVVTGQLLAGGFVVNTSSITQGAGTGSGQISLTNATARQIDMLSSSGDSTNIGLSNSSNGTETWIILLAGNTNTVCEEDDVCFYNLGEAGTRFAIKNANGGVVVGPGTVTASTIAANGDITTEGSIYAGQSLTTASTMSATAGLLAGAVSTQTIAAGNTVTADSCGGLKKLSAASAVTTDTTNTFTAPAAGNHGCCMDVVNGSGNNITLDNNALFKTVGGADIILTPNDAVRVCSDGVQWRQTTALLAIPD